MGWLVRLCCLPTLAESKLRQQMFDQNWITEPNGKAPTIATGWPSRFCTCQIKGEGGSVKLAALNLQLSIRLLPDHNPISNAEQSPDLPRKVWVVDIIDLGGSSPEAQHCCSQCEYVSMWTVGAVFATTGCPCLLNDVRGERMETHGWHSCCAL